MAHLRLCFIGAVALLIAVLGNGCGCSSKKVPPPVVDISVTPAPPAPPISVPSIWEGLVCPTGQTNLLAEDKRGIFQPTAAGTIESALYGTARNAKRGKFLSASFHEGIDIAPLHRDKKGMPLDQARAIMNGRVAYYSRFPGNSNYGRYIVLLHPDKMGEIYSLYAHLAAIEPGIAIGQEVAAGTVIGKMGNSSSTGIPVVRAHLHLEIGVLLNSNFSKWYHQQKLKPDHGIFHGWNLAGVDPLGVYAEHRRTPNFTFTDYLHTVPSAYEIILPAQPLLDYFRRYPVLWLGEFNPTKPMMMACSVNGVPLCGRQATDVEAAQLGKKKFCLQNVQPAVIDRNGTHIIKKQGSSWTLDTSGLQWLAIMTCR